MSYPKPNGPSNGTHMPEEYTGTNSILIPKGYGQSTSMYGDHFGDTYNARIKVGTWVSQMTCAKCGLSIGSRGWKMEKVVKGLLGTDYQAEYFLEHTSCPVQEQEVEEVDVDTNDPFFCGD